MANEEIQVSTENQREAATNHAEVAEFLRQIPQDQEQIVAWLESKGPIYKPLIPEVQRLLDERRAFYDDEAAEHEHLHRGLNKTADAWEAHEDQAISDINAATGEGSHPPMTDIQGGAHQQGIEPLPYPGPARTQPADYTEPTDDSAHPPMTDIQGGAHQQGIEPLPYAGPARTQPADYTAPSPGPTPPGVSGPEQLSPEDRQRRIDQLSPDELFPKPWGPPMSGGVNTKAASFLDGALSSGPKPPPDPDSRRA